MANTIDAFYSHAITNWSEYLPNSDADNTSWFNRLVNGVNNIFSAIGNIATNLANAIGNIFSSFFESVGNFCASVWEFLQDLWDFLVSLPGNIINGIINGFKALFIPEDGFVETVVVGIKENLATKIPYDTYIEIFGTLSDGSYYDGQKDLNIDINNYKISEDLSISTQDFINFDNITEYKNTWHMWVRGFIFILLIIYNVNEFVKLLRGYNVAANVASYNQSSGGGKK